MGGGLACFVQKEYFGDMFSISSLSLHSPAIPCVENEEIGSMPVLFSDQAEDVRDEEIEDEEVDVFKVGVEESDEFSTGSRSQKVVLGDERSTASAGDE